MCLWRNQPSSAESGPLWKTKDKALASLLAMCAMQLVEWSLAMMITGAQSLRDADRRAKKAKAGVWHDYTPPPSSLPRGTPEFSGPVREVVSGDTLSVWDAASGDHLSTSFSLHWDRLRWCTQLWCM